MEGEQNIRGENRSNEEDSGEVQEGLGDPGDLAPPDSELEAEPPDLETLIAWMEEGECEAPDGCWLEPDGICPHGKQSWLLILNLI